MISWPAVNPCRPPIFKGQVSVQTVQTVKLSSTERGQASNKLPTSILFLQLEVDMKWERESLLECLKVEEKYTYSSPLFHIFNSGQN